jgi:hypothetical protein
MAQPTPLYIVASPHPQVGKTLLARLLIEYFRTGDRPLFAYDLNPHEPTLAGHFPELTRTIDIADTRGQMELFDQLIARNSITRVIDLGYAPFHQFFAIMNEIGFVEEARRRSIEPAVLFLTDRAPATVRAYAKLREQLPAAALVPIHNEAVSAHFEKEDFPSSRAEYRMIRIPRLSPIVRGIVDRPKFSFASYLDDRPGGPTEVHSWIATMFNEFRELELRLVMGRLSSALGAADSEQPGSGGATRS